VKEIFTRRRIEDPLAIGGPCVSRGVAFEGHRLGLLSQIEATKIGEKVRSLSQEDM
jgi:hypothetical protein